MNIIDFDFFADVAKDGLDEQRIWQFSWGGRPAFDPVWNMVLESSTGYSGSLGRQVTLNSLAPDKIHTSLMDALEKSAAEGAVVLIATGVDLTNGKSRSFLFEDGQTDEHRRRRLNDYEVASRLSYFLWDSMPDDELFKVASQGVVSLLDLALAADMQTLTRHLAMKRKRAEAPPPDAAEHAPHP